MTQTITIKNPEAPATPAQVSYLTALIEKHDCPKVAARYGFAKDFLTKGAASGLINDALATPKKTAKPVANPAAPAAVKTSFLADSMAEKAETIAPVELPAYGYYDVDGTIYHWGITGKDGYPTLRKLTVITNYDGSKKGKWGKAYVKWDPKMQVMATFLPYMGKHWAYKTEITKKITVPAVLVGKTPMTLEEAAAKGKAFTFCVKCGATLTDPVSVANGIGPVCIKAFQ